MERVFDDLIALQTSRPRWKLACWCDGLDRRLAGNLATGAAIGVGIAVGRALAG